MNSIYHIKAVLTSSLVYDRCLDSNSKKVMHYFTFILLGKKLLVRLLITLIT